MKPAPHNRQIGVGFAGIGGSCLGIEQATGYLPTFAMNHDEQKIGVHARNNPRTRHYCDDIRSLRPREVIGADGRVWFMWFSPDCRDFSRAKGGAPVSDSVRFLAWEVVTWAKEAKPDVLFVENVPEFVQFGPLLNGHPDPTRRGETFREWIAALESLGYVVEWRLLVAADYGAPTTRKRFYLIARRDGQPIKWPRPTHGPGRRKPWRSAAECIDWSLACPSIFTRKRPLAEATCRRIAKGVLRYVITAADPFLVICNHSGEEFRGQDVHSPMSTVTAARDARGVVSPTIAEIGQRHGRGQYSAGKPLHAITRTQRAALSTANLVHMNHGEKQWSDARKPLRTVTAKGQHHAVVSGVLSLAYGSKDGQQDHAVPVTSPAATVTATDHHQFVSATLTEVAHGEFKERAGLRAGSIRKPLGHITRTNNHALTSVHLTKFRQNSIGTDLRQPMPTITSGAGAKRPAGAAHALGPVAATLVHYYGQGGTDQGCAEPLHTVPTRARHALVLAATGDDIAGAIRTARFLMKYADGVPVTWIMVDGKRQPVVALLINGVRYLLTDLGLRMLVPRELARAQGFPDWFVLEGTQAEQIAGIGNSVCPPVAKALVRSQFPRTYRRTRAA